MNKQTIQELSNTVLAGIKGGTVGDYIELQKIALMLELTDIASKKGNKIGSNYKSDIFQDAQDGIRFYEIMLQLAILNKKYELLPAYWEQLERAKLYAGDYIENDNIQALIQANLAKLEKNK